METALFISVLVHMMCQLPIAHILCFVADAPAPQSQRGVPLDVRSRAGGEGQRPLRYYAVGGPGAVRVSRQAGEITYDMCVLRRRRPSRSNLISSMRRFSGRTW